MYSCNLFLKSAIDGMVDQRQAPDAFPPCKKDPVPVLHGWMQVRSGRVRKISPSHPRDSNLEATYA